MYEIALKNVVSEIHSKGYLTFREAETFLQRQIDAFEKYYVRKYNIDPFSVEFVHIVSTEFVDCIRKLPEIRVKKMDRDVTDILGYDEIYGFDTETIEIGYKELIARARRET